MYTVRRWSVRRARLLESLYSGFERALIVADPLWRTLGYARLERPFAFLERHLKGFFFDCQMCGHCVLSSTGMACPMNCPKQLRNGPCGGVRDNGNCEVNPRMRCVWVEASEGAARMRDGLAKIRLVQTPVNSQLSGRSAWLRVASEAGQSRQDDAGASAAGAGK